MELDCSVCANCAGAWCMIYGHDADKMVRACAQSGFRYFVARGGTRYECVEPLRVAVFDNGVPTGEYLLIEKGSIWTVSDVSSDFVGNISLVKDKTLEPLEITWGTLGVFFKRMEG